MPGEGIAIFGTPYNRQKAPRIFLMAQRVFAVSADLKRIGPAALDICLVASGKAKLYFELDLELWDVAAGLLILSEAGGQWRRQDDLWMFSSDPGLFSLCQDPNSPSEP